MARTWAVGSWAVRVGVMRESLPRGVGVVEKDQRRTVLSREEETKRSSVGEMEMEVTNSVWPEK
jgi:hypothetical protein